MADEKNLPSLLQNWTNTFKKAVIKSTFRSN